MMWLLACAEPPSEEAAQDIVPAEGTWVVSWAETYGGDCALDDMDTRQPAEIDWRVELEANGFTMYDEYNYPMGCDLAAGVFGCSLGTYDVSYVESGYDAVEYVSVRIDGMFSTAEAFAGTYSIGAECQGDDCGPVGEQYGNRFTYPCTAVADLSGVYGG